MINSRRLSFLLVLVAIALAALWLVFSKLVVPPLIESAYRGESLPILNHMISGQAVNPIEHYLMAWDRLAYYVLLTLLLAGLIILVSETAKNFLGLLQSEWVILGHFRSLGACK